VHALNPSVADEADGSGSLDLFDVDITELYAMEKKWSRIELLLD
jgi:hypothetical protein